MLGSIGTFNTYYGFSHLIFVPNQYSNMKVTLSTLTRYCAFWQLASTIQAHSWVEQLSGISSSGTFIGTPGYARGNFLRTAPGFNNDQMVNLIAPRGRVAGNVILTTDLMCRSAQTKGNQTPNSPALTASPGDMIALRYQENEHVTEPFNQPGKPKNRGTVLDMVPLRPVIVIRF